MWIFIWFVLSVFILGVFLWSVVILREQKTAWSAFAIKRKLKYESGRFLESGSVSGELDGFRFTLFSQPRKTADVRGERFVSVLEYDMGRGSPAAAAIGTGDMGAFIDTLVFDEAYRPDHPKWKDDFIAKTRDVEVLRRFMTNERVEAVTDVFLMNKVSALYFFDEKDCVLHIETADPLRSAEKLDRIVGRILAAVKVLAPDRPAPPAVQGQPEAAQ